MTFKDDFKQGYNEGRLQSATMPGYQKAIILGIAIVLIACVVFFSSVDAMCVPNDVNTIFPANPQSIDVPRLPETFSGKVVCGDMLIPDGTIVSIYGSNESITTVNGKFGGVGSFDKKLVVSGKRDGDIIRFMVNGRPCNIQSTGWSYTTFHSGQHKDITLVVSSNCCKRN